MMRLFVLLFSALLVATPIGPIGVAAQEHVLNRQAILAVVNGVSILRMHLEEEAKLLEAETPSNLPAEYGAGMDAWGEDLLENLIDRELLMQQTRSKQIKISTRSIDEALQIVKNRFAGANDFARYLNTVGMDENQLRQRILGGLLIRRFLRTEILRNIRVTDAELQAYYSRYPEDFIRPAQVRARHILVSVIRESQRGEAMLKIEALALKLAQGADFGVLASEHSDCPSKSKAGDLGYFTYAEVIPAFGNVAFALSPGQISQVVETRFGYHLLQIIDRSPPARIPFTDVRDKIERTLRCNKENQAVKKYLAQLRNQATLVRHSAATIR